MNETVTEATRLLRSRLSEIESERRQLERALQTLEGRTQQGGRSSTRSSPTRRRSRRRAPRGQRQVEFLEQIKKTPGSRVSEIAKAVGVPPQQLYPVARRLEKEGKVVKQDRGYALSAAAANG